MIRVPHDAIRGLQAECSSSDPWAETMVQCDFVGGPERVRCDKAAGFVAIRGGIPMHRAARCEDHAQRLRELGQVLRTIRPTEHDRGRIDPLDLRDK